MIRLASVLCVFGVSLAHATTVRSLTVEELTRSSDLIVVGVPHERATLWDQGRIFTKVHVSISETWGGAANPSIDVMLLGGVVGDIGQHVAGVPALVAGGTYVLFLSRDAQNRYHPTGLWQGVFSQAAPTLIDTPLSRQSNGATVVGPRLAVPDTLDSLRRRVAEILRGP